MKSELRLKYSALRNSLSEDSIETKSLEIANNLLDLPIWDYDFYHLFLSIRERKEIDTEPILHILLGKDKNVVLSKSDPASRNLTNYLLTDTTKIVVNKWGIPEPAGGIEVKPADIQVVFVPLLAFDQQGHRVGYGKGYYDVFLSGCNANVIKIGLSFFEPEDEIPGILTTDVPLDFCVTPHKTYNFKK